MDTKENTQPRKASSAPKIPSAEVPKGKQRSESPNSSFETGAGGGSTGYDSPPITSSQLSNPEVKGVEHDDPIYAPGGAPDTKPESPKSKEPENTGTQGGE